MTVYISLPITGHDIKIVRTWASAAKDLLRKQGHTPVSPVDICKGVEDSYSVYMGKDIMALLECEAVYFLRGWHESRGCQLEFEAARIYGKTMLFE